MVFAADKVTKVRELRMQLSRRPVHEYEQRVDVTKGGLGRAS